MAESHSLSVDDPRVKAALERLARLDAEEAERKAKSAAKKAKRLQGPVEWRVSEKGNTIGVPWTLPYLEDAVWECILLPENVQSLRALLDERKGDE